MSRIRAKNRARREFPAGPAQNEGQSLDCEERL